MAYNPLAAQREWREDRLRILEDAVNMIVVGREQMAMQRLNRLRRGAQAMAGTLAEEWQIENRHTYRGENAMREVVLWVDMAIEGRITAHQAAQRVTMAMQRYNDYHAQAIELNWAEQIAHRQGRFEREPEREDIEEENSLSQE